jgi:hypothetical protein
VVTAVVIALLDTDLGRDLQRDLDAPALALILPAARDRLLRIAGMAGWLIPAWLLMSGLVLGAIAYALDSLD